MIDFEKELKEILENDPLDILKVTPKTSSLLSPDSRLKASFEEINQFIGSSGHKPTKSRDVNERRLYSRLKGIRESPEKASSLLSLDKYNLLDDIEVDEPLIIETIDDVFDADPLGLLDSSDETEQNIFDLSNLPSKPRASTDFMAKRKPCKDFDRYEEQLSLVQKELKENKRKLIRFTDKGQALVENNYYILGGILLFIESIDIDSEETTIAGKRFRKDGRTRCIFENGTESNMLYRSLAKALYQDGKIVTQTEEQINLEFQKNLGAVKADDELSGYIYILKSLSENADIQSFHDLYKVGFSTTTVHKRIANAKNEPTYLMSPVSIVAEYETYNMNTQKFEKLLHQFFSNVCLNIQIADNNGQMHRPQEWFIVHIDLINRAIELIINGQIQHYQYNSKLKEILPI